MFRLTAIIARIPASSKVTATVMQNVPLQYSYSALAVADERDGDGLELVRMRFKVLRSSIWTTTAAVPTQLPPTRPPTQKGKPLSRHTAKQIVQRDRMVPTTRLRVPAAHELRAAPVAVCLGIPQPLLPFQ